MHGIYLQKKKKAERKLTRLDYKISISLEMVDSTHKPKFSGWKQSEQSRSKDKQASAMNFGRSPRTSSLKQSGPPSSTSWQVKTTWMF